MADNLEIFRYFIQSNYPSLAKTWYTLGWVIISRVGGKSPWPGYPRGPLHLTSALFPEAFQRRVTIASGTVRLSQGEFPVRCNRWGTNLAI